MRKSALLAAAVIASLAAAPTAMAVNADQGLDVSVGPSKGGTRSHPKIVKITVLTTTTPKDDVAFGTRRAIIYFDKYLRFNTKYFKTCAKSVLEAQGPTKCPKGSQVGKGSARGLALGQVENLTIKAFNAKSGHLLLYVQGSAPLQINSTIDASLRTASGSYGRKLYVPIPESLQQPLQGVYATLTRFQTTVYAYTRAKIHGKRRKVGYVETVGCRKKWSFKGDFTFTDSTVKNASNTVKCS